MKERVFSDSQTSESECERITETTNGVIRNKNKSCED